MGLPALNIIFKTAAKEAVKRAQRGIVGMIVKDTAPAVNPAVIYKAKDIPDTLSEDTKEQINLALKGNVNSPSKVVVYVIGADEEDYTKALEYFELKRINWLCCPTITTDAQEEAVKTWVKEQRENRNKVKAILPNSEADSEGVINYATDSVTAGEKTYTAEKFCSRIAGLLAGTPATQGATFAVLKDVAECTKKSREEIDAEIDAGKFVVFNDGEKIKVARAVNSLKTVSEDKGEPWKKIKVVEAMDMINDDLVLLVEDYYIGKYTNTFDNKCLVLTAIKAYFEELLRQGILDSYSVDFDVDAIRDYIVEHKGVPREVAENMPDEEAKKQYTDEKIFMKSAVTIADVMEDITLNIAV